MKIVIQTRCGCTRVVAEGVMFSPIPNAVYAALYDPATVSSSNPFKEVETRRFSLWSKDKDMILYLEDKK